MSEQAKNPPSTILIVEDDAIIAHHLGTILTRFGYDVVGTVPSGEKALPMVSEQRPDLVLMDINLAGDLNGIETAAQIQAQFGVPVVYLTGYAENMVLEGAQVTEPYGYVIKPPRDRELYATIEMALYRHRTEAKLKESEERFRALVENSTDLFTIVGADASIRYQSPAIRRILGYSPDERVGKNAFESIHPHDLSQARALFARLLQDPDITVQMEVRRRHQDGSWRILHATGRNFVDNPAIGGLVVNARDVTERKRAEENQRKALAAKEKALGRALQATRALQESEERYRGVVQDTPVLICRFLPGGEIIFVNKMYCEYFGKTAEELAGSNFLSLIPKADQETVMANISALTLDSPTQSQEHQAIASDGAIRWQRWTNRALFDAQGKVVVYQAIGEDITERKRAENALRESDERFRQVAENASEWIWQVDQNGLYTYASPVIEQILGYAPAEVTDRLHFYDLFDPQDRETLKQAALVTFARKEPFKDFVNVNRHKDGRAVIFSSSGAPMLDTKGNLIGYRGVNVDITERKQAQDTLQKLARDLGERVKELNCLYGISHLVETPDISMDEILEGSIDLIPPAWQYPQVTCARIIHDAREFRTRGFEESIWKQTAGIVVSGERAGVVEVCYRGEKPESDEGPFLKEEQNLLDAIAERLGKIIERKQAEQALQESEERFRNFMDSATEACFLFDSELDYVMVNQVGLLKFWPPETRPEDVLGKNIQDIVPGIKKTGRYDDYLRVIETGVPFKVDDMVPHPVFGDVYLDLRAFKVGNGLGIIVADVSEYKRMEQQIKAALAEKEVLLKEVYHRVKNNLNSLSYLVDMQTETISNPETLQALGDLRGRIEAMSLIHEKLYQAENLAEIDFGEYLDDLTYRLFHAVRGNQRISLHAHIEAILLNANVAIPCGLIVNELVTNALKHAFPPLSSPPAGGTEGGASPSAGEVEGGHEIRVAFGLQDDEYVLTVSDNGVGLPPDLDWQATDSLGLKLTNLWARHQLQGSIEVGRKNGTVFTIRFPR